MPRPSKSLSFRLTGALLQRLTELADGEGMSVGEKARSLLTAVLQDEDRLRVLEEVRGVREQVDRLRSDLATSMETVLLNVSSAATEDQIRAWVSNHLRQ